MIIACEYLTHSPLLELRLLDIQLSELLKTIANYFDRTKIKHFDILMIFNFVFNLTCLVVTIRNKLTILIIYSQSLGRDCNIIINYMLPIISRLFFNILNDTGPKMFEDRTFIPIIGIIVTSKKTKFSGSSFHHICKCIRNELILERCA